MNIKTRICSKCSKRKKLSKFHKSKRHALGRKLECAECTNKYLRNHYNKNNKNCIITKAKRTRYHYRRRYGIRYEDYLLFCTVLNNQCEICGAKKVPAGEQKRGSKDHLVLDHCHNTGEIRGILCQECNQGIGLLKDNLTNLQNAIKYLKRGNKCKYL